MDAKKQFSQIGWNFVLFALIAGSSQLIAGVLVIVLQVYAGELMTGDRNFSVSMVMVVMQVAMYLLSYPILRWTMRRVPSWKRREPRRLGAGAFFLWALACIGLLYIGNLVGIAWMDFLSDSAGVGAQDPVTETLGQLSPWALCLTTVIIAPIMEELVFRKLLIDAIAAYGQVTAVLVSGLGFGLFHGNFSQFFYAAMLGMVFAYLYSSTGRIGYTIALHMIMNSIGAFIPAIVQKMAIENPVMEVFGYGAIGVLMIVSMAAAVILAILYVWRLPWYPRWVGTGRPYGVARCVLTAPGVIAFLLICGFEFLISMIGGI